MKLVTRRCTIEFGRPLVMGIVNLVADSFSGDGIEDLPLAIEHARQLIADGADIIDVGGESAGTKRAAMSEAEEIDRLGPFIEEFLRSCGQTFLSINTWRPAVVRAALAVGGDILNDISALPTPENATICAENRAALVIMHSIGAPKIAHTYIDYADVMKTLDEFFTDKIRSAIDAGLSPEALLLDPGIDFAKQRAENLRIYRELGLLQKFQRPILLPVSRKTVVGEVLNIREPHERDAGTIACVVSGALRGASIFRVHNVRAAVQALATITAIEGVS